MIWEDLTVRMLEILFFNFLNPDGNLYDRLPYFQDKSNLFACFTVRTKKLSLKSALAWHDLPVSSSKHASAADAKLCLTRRMQSKLFAVPARLARALLKK